MKTKNIDTTIKSDCFDSLTISKQNIRYELNESEQKDNEKLSKKILAVIEGQLVVIGGTSRNGRKYIKEPVNFWKYVLTLPEIERRFKDGQVLGRLGHYTGAVTEEQMQNGEVTHRVVFINYETGMGKIYVLDTSSGNALITYLESGTILYVSSRGEGSYRGDSDSIVDWENYDFETIDFVLNPGFFEAKPNVTKINEELEKTQMEDNMDKEFLEKISTMNEAKEQVIRDNATLLVTNESLKKEKDVLVEKLKISESFNESFKLLGNEVEIRAVVNEAQSIIESYKELGLPESIKKCLSLLESYKEIGSVESIKKVFEISERYIEIGSDTEITNALKLQTSIIEKYEAASGGLEKLARIKKIAESYSKKYVSDTARNLSESHGMEVEKVLKLIKKNGINEAKEILEGLTNKKDNYSDFSENFKPELKKEVTEGKPKQSYFESFKANMDQPISKQVFDRMMTK